jgi:hypothetical protein
MAPVTSGTLQQTYEYPIDKKIGLSSRFAVSKASFDQGNQSMGLSLCCNRYGLFSFANLLGFLLVVMGITSLLA